MRLVIRWRKHHRETTRPSTHVAKTPYFPPWTRAGLIVGGLHPAQAKNLQFIARPKNWTNSVPLTRYSVSVDNFPTRGRKVTGDLDDQIAAYRRVTSGC